MQEVQEPLVISKDKENANSFLADRQETSVGISMFYASRTEGRQIGQVTWYRQPSAYLTLSLHLLVGRKSCGSGKRGNF